MKLIVDIPDEEFKLYEFLSNGGMGSTAIRRILDGKPYEERKTAIEALKEQDAGRWIPVTERLPDREGAYIVTVGDIFGNGYVTREWFYGNEWSYSYVVAWMDVKAYEGSEDE